MFLPGKKIKPRPSRRTMLQGSILLRAGRKRAENSGGELVSAGELDKASLKTQHLKPALKAESGVS